MEYLKNQYEWSYKTQNIVINFAGIILMKETMPNTIYYKN